MSLINDALRRAQQEHQKTTPVTVSDNNPPPLRPVEPLRNSGGGAKWIFALLAFLLIGAAIYFLWLGSRQSASSQTTIANNTTPDLPAGANHPPPIATHPDTGVKPAPVVAPPVQTNTVIVVVTNFVAATPPVTNSIATNSPPPAPVFPTLKLQGILYLPSNPSVMLNGKTLHLNEEIEKAKVVAITQNSATVVWSGQTNIMKLR